jgi:hypothetical protein
LNILSRKEHKYLHNNKNHANSIRPLKKQIIHE